MTRSGLFRVARKIDRPEATEFDEDFRRDLLLDPDMIGYSLMMPVCYGRRRLRYVVATSTRGGETYTGLRGLIPICSRSLFIPRHACIQSGRGRTHGKIAYRPDEPVACMFFVQRAAVLVSVCVTLSWVWFWARCGGITLFLSLDSPRRGWLFQRHVRVAKTCETHPIQ